MWLREQPWRWKIGVLGSRESHADFVGVRVVWIGIDLERLVLMEESEVLPAEVKIVMATVMGVAMIGLLVVTFSVGGLG